MDLIVNNFHQLFTLTFIFFDVIWGPQFCCSKFSAHFTPWGLYLFRCSETRTPMFIVCIFNFCTLSCWVTLLCSPQQPCLCFLIPFLLGNLLIILFHTGSPPFEWVLRKGPHKKYLAKWISTRILSQASHGVIKQHKMSLCQKGFLFQRNWIWNLFTSALPIPPHPLWVWAKLTVADCERTAMATVTQYPGSCFQHRGGRDQGREDCDSVSAPALMKMKSSAKNSCP